MPLLQEYTGNNLDERGNDLDETNCRYIPSFLCHRSRPPRSAAFTDLPPGVALQLALPCLSPIPNGREARPSDIHVPSPATATKIQRPPDAKYTASGGAGRHHGQVVGKSLTSKLGWVFMVSPSWPALTWPFPLTGTPWWAPNSSTFKLILILVQGRCINR